MKVFGKMVMGAVALSAVLFLSGLSFAADEAAKPMVQEHHAAKIKLLQDAAAALLATQPALSKELSDYAAMESKEAAGGGEEASATPGSQMKENRATHVKMMKDAAAALETTRPDLAAELTKMVEKHQKMMAAGEKKETSAAADKK
jgi:hypothetical protein